jgi:hypothetical protein
MNISTPNRIAKTTVTILSVAALAVALGAPSTATAASTVPNPSAAESAASNTVAAFDAAHPIPAVTSTDPATYAQQNAAALAYWKAAPVSQMLAQYGCSETGLSIGEQATADGVQHTAVSMVVSCSDPTQLSKTGVSAMLTPRFSSATSLTSQAVHPDTTYGGCSAHSAYCVYGYSSTGELETYYQYQGTSSFTGHVRSGRHGGSCAAGTLIANSTNKTLSQNGYIDLIDYAYTVDSTYSDENVTSGGTVGGIFCETF